jgi:general secretion pathway protein F/type IV pilus assembly protein PilC
MHFKYRGVSRDGKVVKETIVADSYESAKSMLKTKGILVEEIKESGGPLVEIKVKRKIKRAFLADMCRDLSLYIKSGVPLNRALYLLSENHKNERVVSNFFSAVIKHLDEGKGFYDALNNQKTYKLPSFFMLSIKASENLGVMDRVLEDLSNYLKEQEALSKESMLALIYPLFIMVTSFLILGFLLGYVVPTIVSVYADIGRELPMITRVIITLSEFVQAYFIVMMLLFTALIGAFSYGYKNLQGFRYLIDKVLLKIPFVKKFIEYIELARFSNLASILSHSGISTAEVLALCSDVPSNSVIKGIFSDATKRVIEGEKLSVALSKAERFKLESSFIKALALAEETSTFSLMMGNLSTMYGAKARNFTKTLTAMIEPVMMLFVGGLVGFIVAGMLLPIFSLNIG